MVHILDVLVQKVLVKVTLKQNLGNFLTVQWLRVCATNAQDVGSIPGWETKIPHAVQCGQKIKNVFFKALKKPEPKYA